MNHNVVAIANYCGTENTSLLCVQKYLETVFQDRLVLFEVSYHVKEVFLNGFVSPLFKCLILADVFWTLFKALVLAMMVDQDRPQFLKL